MTQTSPLVSIGLPTYNRRGKLQRAIDSVLHQSYRNIELVISDNASSDGTQAMCEEYARTDSRVVYFRHPVNVGMMPNFNNALESSTAPYFMWLSDDDWLDEAYVEQCVKMLEERPDYAVVSGINRYYIDDVQAFDCEVVQIEDEDQCRRVLKLYRTSEHLGLIYGLMRREHILRGFVEPAVMWEDLFFVGTVVFRGKAAMLDSICVHRSRAGASSTDAGVQAHYGVNFKGYFSPHWYRGVHAAKEVLHHPAYRSLSAPRRYLFACQVLRHAFFRDCGPHPINDSLTSMKWRMKRTWLWQAMRGVVRR